MPIYSQFHDVNLAVSGFVPILAVKLKGIMKFVGREKELQRLRTLYEQEQSEFVAVFGRRRIGKTMLIREAFKGQFTFYVTGTANSTKTQQLANFQASLMQYSQAESLPPVKNWFAAFQQLIRFLEAAPQGKKLVFFDELPWFDTPRSDFIQSLEHFWNSWASFRTDVLLVVCGSAASWMINELINHRGGLHNRVTAKIKLEAFSLREAEMMLKHRNSAIDRYQILQFYMVTGGVPYYLNTFAGDLSAMQNIEQICFTKDGLLRNEFKNLYQALYAKAERHIAVVEAIAEKSKGLTREEIIAVTKLPNNGNTSKILQELEESGFIRRYVPYKKRERDCLYQLVDFYSHFYLRFIRGATLLDGGNWLSALDSPQYRAWSGYAFEQICQQHLSQIKQSLGVEGVQALVSSWRSKSKTQGTQIDLLIDRRDHVVNLCEIKFSMHPFTITKQYSTQLQQKIAIFKQETDTKKAVWLTFITTFGLVRNEYAQAFVHKELTMDDLFV